jgi:predicted alpha/beta hydrolase
LSRQLAARGFNVLRFDYYGSGDSAGDDSEMRLSGSCEDIVAAIEELKDICDAKTVALIGLRLGASLAGIDATRTTSLIFAVSGLLAALAGALLAPLINPSPDVGAFPAVKSYVIVVLGGMGSIWGAMIASLLLGVLESFFAVYVSYDYRDAFGLIILMLVLIFRPQGLIGEKGRDV